MNANGFSVADRLEGLHGAGVEVWMFSMNSEMLKSSSSSIDRLLSVGDGLLVLDRCVVVSLGRWVHVVVGCVVSLALFRGVGHEVLRLMCFRSR